MKDYRDIIIRPVVTEKSMNLLADNKYTFIVDKRANKTEVKNAIENIFNVKVESVRTMNIKGKPKRMGRFVGGPRTEEGHCNSEARAQDSDLRGNVRL